MNKKGFRADSWLISGADRRPANPISLASSVSSAAARSFEPTNYLVPGWRGESLPNKSTVILSRAINDLWLEAKRQLQAITRPTKSLAAMVHEEFLLYCSCRELSLTGLEVSSEFWRQLHDEEAPYAKELANFKDIYSFRAVTVYLFKIRFLNVLMHELHQNFHVAHMANPSNLISKLFRAGSSTELVCDSLKPNCYSWFRPCAHKHNDCLNKLHHVLDRTHITEMVKMCSFKSISGASLSDEKIFDDSPYSHSISHRSFGRFLSLNLIYMPKWLQEQDSSSSNKKGKELGVLKTKFVGDQLGSLCLSHWLAQEENVDKKWEEIICPDFVGKDFTDGSFVKICHELQFLTFLVSVAKKQHYPVLNLIATTMREKYERGTNGAGQVTLFGNDRDAGTSTYKRIVLNLTKAPKKNPHQHLISKIRDQLKDLDQSGWLFVLTSQKLFVPSRTDKLQQLLTLAKVHAGISLEGIKGKGEIPHYLYVFSHRNKNIAPAGARESYQHFQWEGELNMFSRFSWYHQELEKFLASRSAYATPLYQAESEGRTFNFHQDALFEGKLLTSTNDDNSRITHPTFFKKLTGGCIPFDQYFMLEGMDESQVCPNTNQDFLGLLFKPRQHHPFVIVVDTRNPEQVQLELIAAEAYKAKREQYGTAYFHYFGLMPKMPDINPNLFRIFFQSSLGKQLIQLSLGGSAVNLKSKLNGLLIPAFFSIPRFLPEDLLKLANVLELDCGKILSSHPQSLMENFGVAERIVRDTSKKFAWHTLSLLAGFKAQLSSAASGLEKSPRESVNYQNPLILEPLLGLKSKPLLPNHSDLFVKVVTGNRLDLEMEVSRVSLVKNQDDCFIEVHHSAGCAVELHGEEDYLHFVRFVLSGSLGVKISTVIQGLHLPCAKELSKVVSRYKELEQSVTSLHQKTESLIDQILHSNLNHN